MPTTRSLVTLAGVGVLAVALLGAGLDLAARVGMVAAVMATWWLLEPVPRPLTGVLPVLLWPWLGVRTLAEVTALYAHPLLLLMAAGFLLGHAMAQVSLHERLTAVLMRPAAIRRSPQRTLLALMGVGAVLSALVSNSATMVMVLPLALSLADRGGIDPRRRAAFALGLGYACSLGGMMTLVGTPPNAVLAGLSPSLGGPEIGFADWMAVGVPLALLLVPLSWWVVVHSTKGVVAARLSTEPPPPGPAPPWSRGERPMLLVVAAALLGWLTRRGVALGPWSWEGWGVWVDAPGSQGDAWVAVVAAFACFAIRVQDDDDPSRTRPLLDGRAFQQGIAWSVLLVMGGGFALADALGATGLDARIASALTVVGSLPPVMILPLLVLSVSLMTELTSNTATAQLLLPIVASTAAQLDAPVTSWLVATTLATSCAFMMPVATPPNAIAAEAGGVDGRTMASVGWRLNLVSAVVIALVSAVWVPRVLG